MTDIPFCPHVKTQWGGANRRVRWPSPAVPHGGASAGSFTAALRSSCVRKRGRNGRTVTRRRGRDAAAVFLAMTAQQQSKHEHRQDLETPFTRSKGQRKEPGGVLTVSHGGQRCPAELGHRWQPSTALGGPGIWVGKAGGVVEKHHARAIDTGWRELDGFLAGGVTAQKQGRHGVPLLCERRRRLASAEPLWRR